MGAFDHLEWTYDGTFEQLFGLGRGEFEQKFSKNSNARGVARGGMLKLRFDWYIICTFSTLGIQNVIPNGCWSVTAITHKSQSNEKVTETEYHLKFSVQCGWQDEMMQWLIYMGLWQWCFYGDFNYE